MGYFRTPPADRTQELIEESKRLAERAQRAIDDCKRVRDEVRFTMAQTAFRRLLGSDPNCLEFINNLAPQSVPEADASH